MTESVSSSIHIDAAPEAVMTVLTDFEAYPVWARAVKSAAVVSTDPEGRAERVDFCVSAGPLGKKRYVLHYIYGSADLRWDYVEGDFRDIRGSYELTASGSGTEVTYNLAIDPGSIPLPGFVKARASREISRIALKELKRRVEAA